MTQRLDDHGQRSDDALTSGAKPHGPPTAGRAPRDDGARHCGAGRGIDSFDYLVASAELFLVTLASSPLGRVSLSAPAACPTLGLAIDRMGLVPSAAGEADLGGVAQAIPAIVLFAGASQTRFRALGGARDGRRGSF